MTTMKAAFSTALIPTALILAVALAGCNRKPDEATAERDSTHVAPTVAPSIAPATQDPAGALHLRTFEGTDSDGDGFVSAAENAAAAASVFHAIDSDGDGAMGPGELDAAREAMGLSLRPPSAVLIARADQDGDGRLTLAEWIAQRNRDFDAADKDGDGKLSRAEWQGMFRIEAASQPK
jgi:hypothetical protein